MATSTTSGVYIHVIEDVVNKVREEFFASDGPGEVVLNELQALWETKMMQAGVIYGPTKRAVVPPTGGIAAPVHDLNVPYEGTEEYETPTSELLFPPTPLQTPMRTPLPGMVQTPIPGTADSSTYNIPTGGSDYATPQDSLRHSPYMQSHSPWMNQRPPLDVNVAYEEARERDRKISNQPLTQDFFTVPSAKRRREDFNPNNQNGGQIPQEDGPSDFEYSSKVRKFYGTVNNQFARLEGSTSAQQVFHLQLADASNKIPQLDGPMDDPYDDAPTPNIYHYQGVVSEDYNVANTPAPASTPIPAVQNDLGDDDEDEPLNENDDDDELDDVDDDEELNTQHLVLAQFDKVSRTKSRWKCILKDGIMHINNKDILFNKAMGEFEF